MRFSRLPFITLFAAGPIAAGLADTSTASAETHQACVARIQAEHLAICQEARRENIHATCPPLTAADIQRQCGSAPVPVNGSLRPKFTVVSVVYSPPGSANKGSGSSVDYGSGSTIGVSESATSTFKNDFGVTASATLGSPVTGSFQFDISASSTDTSSSTTSLDIKKQQSFDINVAGPSADGIDHDQDEIWVLLTPVINVQAVGSSVTWSEGMDSGTVPQFARVGWLRDPSTMPAGVAQTLAAHGVTPADYPTMLARDPYSAKPRPVDNVRPPAPPDPSRFLLQDLLTYEPDSSQTTETYALKSDTTNTSSTTGSDSFSIGFTATASVGFTDWLKVGLKDSSTWTWTNSATSSNSADVSQSATAKIVNPSLAYGGPTDIAVYWDTVYRTFLFFPVSGAPVLTGLIQDASGQPSAAADVAVNVGGRTVHAFTNKKGVYRVYGVPSGNATVSALGTSRAATLGSTTTKVDLRPSQPTQPSQQNMRVVPLQRR